MRYCKCLMSAPQTIVIGRTSVLAREFAARHADAVLRRLGHAQADDPSAYAGARCVVNFAFAPALEESEYAASLDIDRRVAAHAAKLGLHYVMISSRRVYAPQAQWNANESAPATGMDAYGRNKARIEVELREALGSRLTVLRPGNVIAYEPLAGRRRFGAYLQSQLLAHGRIRLTVEAGARRDLVPAGFFCAAVRAAAEHRIAGTFNVGAGRATAVGEAARWLIEGYGEARLEVDPTQPPNEFQLDTRRFEAAFGLRCGDAELAEALRDIGRRIAVERAAARAR